MSRPLVRATLVDALVDALRDRILDGALAPGDRLREIELCGEYDVSRHTLRTALRQLATEGLVAIEPQKGAKVAQLDRSNLIDLFELRTALEVEAARLALERGDGKLPREVSQALKRLVAASNRARPSWRAVAECHEALHRAIVVGSQSPRIIAAYDALAGEMRVFLMQLRPAWPLDRMGPHHQALVEGLEAGTPDILRTHIRDGRDAVLGSAGK